MRAWAPVAAAVVLVGCMVLWTWLQETDRVGPRAPIRDPATADGAVVTLTLYDLAAVEPGRWHLTRSGEAFDVAWSGAAADVGAVVTVQGRWRAADAVVVADRVAVHPDRARKGYLGMAGIAFLVVASPFWYRVERWRLVARA